MRYKTFLAALVVSAIAVSLIGCGVPKTEHEKIVKELQQANQDKMALTDQLDKADKEKAALSQQIAQLQAQVNTLRKENGELKAKLAPKKPAAPAKQKKRSTK